MVVVATNHGGLCCSVELLDLLSESASLSSIEFPQYQHADVCQCHLPPVPKKLHSQFRRHDRLDMLIKSYARGFDE